MMIYIEHTYIRFIYQCILLYDDVKCGEADVYTYSDFRYSLAVIIYHWHPLSSMICR